MESLELVSDVFRWLGVVVGGEGDGWYLIYMQNGFRWVYSALRKHGAVYYHMKLTNGLGHLVEQYDRTAD